MAWGVAKRAIAAPRQRARALGGAAGGRATGCGGGAHESEDRAPRRAEPPHESVTHDVFVFAKILP